MPQWFRDRTQDAAKYPDERWCASARVEHVALLRRYDHHVVWIDRRAALLLTYAWATEPIADEHELPPFEVSFTYAPGHPRAPADVQAIIDQLEFRPVPSGSAQQR